MQNSTASLPTIHAVILAAGHATRMGGPIPKPYLPLAGMPILRHSILIFQKIPQLASLTVVTQPEHATWYNHAIEGLCAITIVSGGSTRKHSVYNALQVIAEVSDKDLILIHDAARPMIQFADIMNLCDSLRTNRMATLAAPVVDTLRHEEGETIDRSKVYAVQTPQGFWLSTLKDAHEKANETGADFTDDCSLVQAMLGIVPDIVQGSARNFKITTAEDYAMAQMMVMDQKPPLIPRIGTGYDVHAFEATETPSRVLRLGGVTIPNHRALAGHSDADVVLHALTDALLGAIADGDIGVHFPPSDAQYKNMDSSVFLQFASDKIKAMGGVIYNVDITIICEEPKISPHASAMRQRIASILQIAPSQIGLKATTSEGLGFTGRREGIATQAVASIGLPA